MSAEDRDTLTRAGDGVLSLGVPLAAAALRGQAERITLRPFGMP